MPVEISGQQHGFILSLALFYTRVTPEAIAATRVSPLRTATTRVIFTPCFHGKNLLPCLRPCEEKSALASRTSIGRAFAYFDYGRGRHVFVRLRDEVFYERENAPELVVTSITVEQDIQMRQEHMTEDKVNPRLVVAE